MIRTGPKKRDALVWGGAVIAGAAVALFLWSSGVFRTLRPTTPNVLVITIDTLRADRLGSYGYAAARTPTLDRLAARGTRFEQATSVGALTLPAHTSLFTATFPGYHGVRDNGGFYVEDAQVTLAELLRDKGYRTAGFVGAFVLDSRWGINQGFEHYVDDFDLSKAAGTGMDTIQRPGNEVVQAALDWLKRESDKPFFAWVHLYDPHTPYTAPDAFRSGFPATISGAYDAEIAFADTQAGRLLDFLEQQNRLDDTIVVALGDHGESLGEHREQTHGFFIYDATIRIPLVLAGPGVSQGVVRDQVRIIDVAPSILDLLEIPVPGVMQGRTLVPAARGERLDIVSIAESWFPRYHYGWSELTALREGRFKFILAPTRELYDLQADPGETTNLAAREPARAQALENALRDLLERTASRSAARGPRKIDPEVEERLRALGYVGGSVSARKLQESPRGDPKDKIHLYNLLKSAGQDSVNGEIDQAIAKVREALRADEEIVEAYTMLGNLHVKAKRYDAAVEAYRGALQRDPEHQGAAFSLALAYKSLGRFADAEAGFQRAHDLDPRGGKAVWQLADIWMQRRDFERAERALKQALTLEVDRPSFLLKLGECYLEMQRYDDAEAQLRRALAERPDMERAHYDLGLLYEARGDADRAIAEYEQELSRNPETYSASFNLAKLLSRAGRHSDAAARFRQAVAANPDFGTAYLYLAKSLLDVGDLRGAEDAARRGLASKPEAKVAPLGHYVLADVYNRLGRPRDAAREVARARILERGL